MSDYLLHANSAGEGTPGGGAAVPEGVFHPRVDGQEASGYSSAARRDRRGDDGKTNTHFEKHNRETLAPFRATVKARARAIPWMGTAFRRAPHSDGRG